MSDKWILTQESFDDLIMWLGPDREKSGLKYEDIREGLIRIFICRGCPTPEELADESINRVAKRLKDIKDVYTGDQALYFYGVAKKVFQEYLKRPRIPTLPLLPEHSEKLGLEREYDCLDHCMEQLPLENRTLVMRYYQKEQCEKIVQRKQLAEQFGMALNALRIRAHRIRAMLRKCMYHCLEQQIDESVN
jgi:DNA-directed RNA polymerase specialized sigma24 family protein